MKIPGLFAITVAGLAGWVSTAAAGSPDAPVPAIPAGKELVSVITALDTAVFDALSSGASAMAGGASRAC